MKINSSRRTAVRANTKALDLNATGTAQLNGSVHFGAFKNFESEQTFSAILDTLEQQVTVIDAHGNILWVNKAWKSFSAENGGNPDQTWDNVNYLETCRASASRTDTDAVYAEAGIRNVVNGALPSFNFEYPCHSQREQRWFMMSVKPLAWDGPGYFVISHLNITERKLAELEQENINDLYEESQKIGKVGSWRLDLREGAERTRYWSKEMYKMHGVTPGAAKKIKEAHFYDVMYPGDRLRVMNAYERSIIEKRPCEIEYRVVTSDGCVKYLREHCDTKFDGAGQPLSSAGTVQDITTRRQAEKDKSDFVSFVSHELRTPLTSIRGSISLAKSGSVGEAPSELQSLLDIAHRNTERLMKLVDEILDADRLSSGKFEMHIEKMDIVLFVREHAQAEKGYGDELGVTFKVKDPDHPIWVDGDKNRLAQVMANLMSNAAKCSNRGSIVEVSVEQSSAGKVRVSVSDNGPGISEHRRAAIFEKFAQLESPSQKKETGTGLGLAIAKLIVEEHGGTIDLTSEVGKGTTFYFELDNSVG